ncbi:MAG TPA: hypothetical protein VFZ09_04020 [Archangium sp.]|uniref:hypothetical protein n=1 Tax=Archangium sp. TaxID=1872627 RepID=UPI002E34B7B0|nr:hypothetical protein [Archangium sp.]HEX5745385.1 hypothetical protein [Archangium sp.]
MRRVQKRSFLSAMLSGLLLTACGGAPEEGAGVAEEPTGTRESAMCSVMSVSQLGLNGVSSYGGVLAGAGTWTTSTFANGAYLLFYVDGVERSRQESYGTYDSVAGVYRGNWSFSVSGITCGSHTFQVKAYPMNRDSAGQTEICTGNTPQTSSQTVVQACPTATLSCSRVSTTSLSCTGGASGGTGIYTPMWRRTIRYSNGTSSIGSWASGSWTKSYSCAQTSTRDNFNRLEIDFKVVDDSGMESNVDFHDDLCGA